MLIFKLGSWGSELCLSLSGVVGVVTFPQVKGSQIPGAPGLLGVFGCWVL